MESMRERERVKSRGEEKAAGLRFQNEISRVIVTEILILNQVFL